MLVEGDDFNEPIPDAVKGITDGHLWLNRALASRGHYPAVDVVQSISRVRGDVCDADHLRMARRVLSLVATYNQIEDLVNIGAYVPGANLEYDVSVQARPRIAAYLQQGPVEACTLAEAKKQLMELLAWIDQLEKAASRAGGEKCGTAAGQGGGELGVIVGAVCFQTRRGASPPRANRAGPAARAGSGSGRTDAIADGGSRALMRRCSRAPPTSAITTWWAG